MRWLYVVTGGVCGAGTGAVASICASLYFSACNSMFLSFLAVLALPIFLLLGLFWGIKGGDAVRRHLLDDLYEASRKTRVLYLVRLAVGVLGVNVFLANLCWHTFEPPADRQFLAAFEQNRDTWERLAAMTEADEDLFYLNDHTYNFKDGLEAGLKAGRFAEYQKLMAAVPSLRCVLRVSGRPGTQFCTWAVGGAVSSTTAKGYLYARTPPAPLLSTLDGITRGSGYRHITGNWYLYYKYTPEF